MCNRKIVTHNLKVLWKAILDLWAQIQELLQRSGGNVGGPELDNEKSQIFSTSDFAKFALVLVKGVNLGRPEYFVSPISWLEAKLSKTIRLNVGKRKSTVFWLFKDTVTKYYFHIFPLSAEKEINDAIHLITTCLTSSVSVLYWHLSVPILKPQFVVLFWYCLEKQWTSAVVKCLLCHLSYFSPH